MSFSPDISDIVSFSRELRNAREFQSISLEEIERATRITRDHLEALESGRWNAIPDGFLRGFVGAYADAIKTNRARVLRDFDKLMSPESADARARLEKQKPLLKQPEQVGLTRAKFAATWFADLTSRTHLKSVLIAIALIMLLLTPAWLRISTQPDPPLPMPLQVAIADYAEHTHGPITTIPLEAVAADSITSQLSAKSVNLIARSVGHVKYRQDSGRHQELIISPLDTVIIKYLNTLSVAISPDSAAFLMRPSDPSQVDTAWAGTTATYTIHPPRTQPPSPESSPVIAP